MSSDAAPMAFVLLVGPQASGKGTLAQALSRELREQGERVALVELDRIAEMALPTLPSWSTAASIFGVVAGEWVRADLTCVVAEGIASDDEISIVLARVPSDAALVVVAMTTPLEAALQRAEGDPTRGLSRDRGWLTDRYQEWSSQIDIIAADVLLDMGSLSVDQGVHQIRAAMKAARSLLRQRQVSDSPEPSSPQAHPRTDTHDVRRAHRPSHPRQPKRGDVEGGAH